MDYLKNYFYLLSTENPLINLSSVQKLFSQFYSFLFILINWNYLSWQKDSLQSLSHKSTKVSKVEF